MTPLFHNEDCTNFFHSHELATVDGGAAIDAYVDLVADAGVTAFLCNTNAARVNYASNAWEPYWAGLQAPAAGISQSANNHHSPAAQNQMSLNMLALHQQGIDYPARVLNRCRERGLSAWISLRMNDVHSQDMPDHPRHSTFWRQNPHLRRQGYEGYYSRALDYEHAEVRDHYMRLIDETLDRFDIDGLELDFLREPYLFSRGREAHGQVILTDWIAQVRQRVRVAQQRRGHRIQLGVRVPSRPDVAMAFGLDAVTWARRQLVDLITVGPRWATLEYDMPLTDWRLRLADTAVTLLGGLDVLIRPFRSANQRGVRPDEALGAAAQVMHQGAQGIYLFNYFPNGSATGDASWWSPQTYLATLQAMTSSTTLFQQPRRHVVTFNDVKSPDGNEGWGSGHPQLPAEGQAIALTLPTGPQPADHWQAELALQFAAPPQATPAVTVNGLPLNMIAPAADPPANHGRWVIPVAALREDTNQITIRAADDQCLTVVWTDITLIPPKRKVQ